MNTLRGNPGHRAEPDEPKPDPVTSSIAPAWLEAEARVIWDGLAPELLRLGLLTKLDVAALAGACSWWAIYLKARRALKTSLVQTKGTGKQARPEVGIARDAFRVAMDVFIKFGVTPSERRRLAAPSARPAGGDSHDSAQPIDPLDELAARRAARTAQPSA